MVATGETCLELLGTVALTAPYWVSAWLKTTGFKAAVSEFANLKLPAPKLATAATIVIQATASAAIIAGVFTWASVLALMVFTWAASILAHDFWRHTGPERTSRRNAFLANMGLAGGLLLVALLRTPH